jgi:hypothetical protein
MIRRTGKKFLTKVLICALIISLAGGAAFAVPVPADVAGSAQEEAITALVEAGVITGSDDGLFHPLNNLTRAEACAIIVRALGPPDADIIGTPTQSVPASGFPDMRGYGWAEGYVSYAVRYNIVTGYPDGTFRPGNNVTSNEMLTMALRAMEFTNEEIGPDWPADFVAKANQEGITAGLSEPLPDLATKEIAARMAYNKLDELRAIGAERHAETDVESGENGENNENQDISWNAEDLTFATGRFNDNMTTFAGVPISANVVVYTYGVRSAYSRSMELPTSQSDYRRDTVHKFKLANTPAFYLKTGNEITLIILPRDTGFSGRIYGVINSVSVTTNVNGDRVNILHTLAAGQQVSWLTSGLNVNVPSVSDPMSGQIYELTARNGTINNIFTDTDAGSHSDFVELTTDGGWMEVQDFSNGVMRLQKDDIVFAVADNAVVYILNSDGKSYRVGRLSDIRRNSEIRAFSISETVEIASIITVNRR